MRLLCCGFGAFALLGGLVLCICGLVGGRLGEDCLLDQLHSFQLGFNLPQLFEEALLLTVDLLGHLHDHLLLDA